MSTISVVLFLIKILNIQGCAFGLFNHLGSFTGYTEMTLAQLNALTPQLIQYYNSLGGLPALASYNPSFCCIITKDGVLFGSTSWNAALTLCPKPTFTTQTIYKITRGTSISDSQGTLISSLTGIGGFKASSACGSTSHSSIFVTTSCIPTTLTPTRVPSKNPTKNPTKIPSKVPTKNPTKIPTKIPTIIPTNIPTHIPTKNPTKIPTNMPSMIPSKIPTNLPSINPTKNPTNIPTITVTVQTTINNGFLAGFAPEQRTTLFIVMGVGGLLCILCTLMIILCAIKNRKAKQEIDIANQKIMTMTQSMRGMGMMSVQSASLPNSSDIPMYNNGNNDVLQDGNNMGTNQQIANLQNQVRYLQQMQQQLMQQGPQFMQSQKYQQQHSYMNNDAMIAANMGLNNMNNTDTNVVNGEGNDGDGNNTGYNDVFNYDDDEEDAPGGNNYYQNNALPEAPAINDNLDTPNDYDINNENEEYLNDPQNQDELYGNSNYADTQGYNE